MYVAALVVEIRPRARSVKLVVSVMGPLVLSIEGVRYFVAIGVIHQQKNGFAFQLQELHVGQFCNLSLMYQGFVS